jgi:tRNA (guanine-N7-)-methyltransferase
MGRKNKLAKFAELDQLPNVFQNISYEDPHLLNNQRERVTLRGRWHEDYFHNQNPIVLELACGKGEYSTNIAKDFPKNTIGIDLKGNRLWAGAKRALEQNLPNAAFLRTQIEHLSHFFAPEEVAEIWIVFADPQLGKPRKRLTAPRYLKMYETLLGTKGILHLKTDSPELYEFSLETLSEQGWEIIYHSDDIYASELYCPELAYKTHYETMHLQNKKTIKYLRAQWKG